jgi:hypothetical protein
MHYSTVSKLLATPRFKTPNFVVHPQIAWAKLRALRNGAAIASKKLWS